MAAYRQQVPTFPAVNATVIAACSASWQKHLNLVNGKAALTPLTTSTAALLVFSPYNVSSVAEALSGVSMQFSCGMNAVTTWLASLAKGLTPSQAAEATGAAIAGWYAAGECSPK